MFRKLLERVSLSGTCLDVLVVLQLKSTVYWSVAELVQKTGRSEFWVKLALRQLTEANCVCLNDEDHYKISNQGQDLLLETTQQIFAT